MKGAPAELHDSFPLAKEKELIISSHIIKKTQSSADQPNFPSLPVIHDNT